MVSRKVIAIPGGPVAGVVCNADEIRSAASAWADVLPLLLTVWPVNVVPVDVPSDPVSVTVAV